MSTRRLNQAPSVLAFGLDFLNVSVVLLTRAPFCVLGYLCVLPLGCSCQVVSISASD